MRTITAYKAFDKQIFTDAEECRKHEGKAKFDLKMQPIIKKYFPIKFQQIILPTTGSGRVLHEFYRKGIYDTIYFGKLKTLKEVVDYCFKNNFRSDLDELNNCFAKADRKLKSIMIERSTEKYYRDGLHF